MSSNEKCMVFPINFSQYGKTRQNAPYGVNLGNWHSHFSHSMDDFSQYDSHPIACFIKWEMHGFPHQFPIVQENATKPIVWGEPGTHTFPTVWVLFSIRFPSYGVLHHMGNAWVFSSNFPQHSETHRMGNTQEIGSHTFSIKWVLFSLDCHPIVYFIIWDMQGFSRQFPKAWEIAGKPIEWEKPEKLISGKILQNPSYVENLGNWYSYFCHSMGAKQGLKKILKMYFG